MESELMQELRRRIDQYTQHGHCCLPEIECQLLAEEYQKKIKGKIWPLEKQEQFKAKLKKIITEHASLTDEIAEKLSEKFIKETMRKIGDTLSDNDEKRIAHGWEIDITRRGAICFSSKISDKKLTPKAIIHTREISKETMARMPAGMNDALSNFATGGVSFWKILKESLIYWLTGHRP